MAVRVVLELLVLLAVIQKCATASHFPNHCPDGYLARAIETPKGGVMQRCCLPIPTNQCPPEHEVVPCKEDKGADLCVPCDKGYVQPHFSDSFNGNACQGPGITCNEETEAVYQQGIWTCQCNASRGYCGDPTNCERPEPGCPKGLHLHHSSCECIPLPGPGPSKSSMMETTTPTKTVSSEMTTVPNQTLVTQKSPRNGSKAKQEKESRPHELLVDGHSLSESAVEDKDEPKPTSSRTGHATVITISVIVGVVVLAFITIMIVLVLKKNARNYVLNLCSVFILNNFAGTASAPTNDSANDLVEGNPSQEESSETESLRRPIPEQGAAVAEEGSVGNAPDETLLKRPQNGIDLHMSLDD